MASCRSSGPAKTSSVTDSMDTGPLWIQSTEISVSVDYGYNVPDVAFKIQQTVKHNVEAMTEYKVSKVNVHVVGVEFSEEHFSE